MKNKLFAAVVVTMFGLICLETGLVLGWRYVASGLPISSLVEMDVTAYCPCELCCGRFADGITASGKPATGFLVAAPPNIPFGTLMVIPGYANGLPVPVLDRGGSIKADKIDVLFPSHQEALNWGRQRLKVRIYEREAK